MEAKLRDHSWSLQQWDQGKGCGAVVAVVASGPGRILSTVVTTSDEPH